MLVARISLMGSLLLFVCALACFSRAGQDEPGERTRPKRERETPSAAVQSLPQVSACGFSIDDKAQPDRRVDPAAWGSDHVGKPFPAYMTGDECLFCHRKIGPAWGDNQHQLTIRAAAPEDPAVKQLRRHPRGNELTNATDHLLGSGRTTRFLKRSKEYGKFEMLTTAFVGEKTEKTSPANPPTAHGALKDSASPTWNKSLFEKRCAGCHATAVNSNTRAFSAVSLDCFVCHGDVPLGHTKDTRRVLLSRKNREPRQVVSLCGQCHLRGGKSKSTGRPYPNTFVAGDNLFRDFQVDFTEQRIKSLPLVEQHIYLNIREVAIQGEAKLTCLNCHDVHRQTTERHQRLGDRAICSSCHVAGSGHSKLRAGLPPTAKTKVSNAQCDY